jgi:hypothetical protein
MRTCSAAQIRIRTVADARGCATRVRAAGCTAWDDRVVDLDGERRHRHRAALLHAANAHDRAEAVEEKAAVFFAKLGNEEVAERHRAAAHKQHGWAEAARARAVREV